MTPFAFQAATRDGQRVAGTLAAESEVELRSALRRRGLFVIEVGDVATPAAERRTPGWRRFVRSARSVTLEFTRELATLLEARFSLDRSLALLGETFDDPRTSAMVLALRTQVREGVPFSRALRAYPRFFSEFYTRMIAAGEEAGRLDTIVGRLAAHLEASDAVRGRITSALVYPAVVTAAGAVAILVLLLVVLPKFVALVEGAGSDLPLSTTVLVFMGGFVGDFWWLLASLGGAGAWALVAYRRTPRGRYRLDWLDLRAPVWGRLRLHSLVARFCRTLATLVESGVPFLTALRTAGATIRNSVLGQGLDRVEEQVRRGRPMTAALEDGRLFPGLAVQMLRVGEESGELPRMLDKVADIYERKLREETDRLVALLEPGMIVVLGLAVGFVALAIFQAVFSMNRVPL